jgi:CheY-like chemotaxis protein
VAKRILVVEDNDLNRKLFCDLLVANGFTVEPVADGREALDRARQFVPGLVIMDIQLPNISGLELIEALKADPVLRQIPCSPSPPMPARATRNASAKQAPRAIWPSRSRSARSCRR